MVVAVEPKRGSWGTWEELILACAVLRHGIGAWEAVASELRARTLHPYLFNPEACKARYGYLQQQYSGCKVLLEVLRKRRVAELRKSLEESEYSIGVLELRLESLKAERGDANHKDQGSSHIGALPHLKEAERAKSSSGASLTQGTQVSVSSQQKQPITIQRLSWPLWKSNGKRERRGCTKEPREWCIERNEYLGSSSVCNTSCSREISTTDLCPMQNSHDRSSLPMKPRSMCPQKRKSSGNVVNDEFSDPGTSEGYKRMCNGEDALGGIRRRDGKPSNNAKNVVPGTSQMGRKASSIDSRPSNDPSKSRAPGQQREALQNLGSSSACTTSCSRENSTTDLGPMLDSHNRSSLPMKPRSICPQKLKAGRNVVDEFSAPRTLDGYKRMCNSENALSGTKKRDGKLSNNAKNVVFGTSQMGKKASNIDSRPSNDSSKSRAGGQQYRALWKGWNRGPRR
ncbi:hypothetical protein NMG60_11014786 [Bertholletia excelsa]